MGKRIGWIGTGVMGRYMCENLMKTCKEVDQMTIFTRTASKAQPLVDLGAKLAQSPKEVAENSDVVFSIVGYPKDVQSVMLNTDTGVLAGLKKGAIVVDCTTSQPSLAEEIFALGQTKGIQAIDAPVSGGDVGAKNATLSFMIGGPKEAVDELQPFFEAMGKTLTHVGPAGQGQHTKMVNQILIATNMIGVSEALLYSSKAGLDIEQVLKAVSSGAAGSWSLSNLAPRMVDDNFEPGFFVEHFVKDMEIALDEARRMNLSLPGLALAHQLYVALKAQGKSHKGTQALLLALEKLNGLERKNKKTV